MFRTICFTAVLGCTAASFATVRSDVPAHYSRRELKAMVQSAHSAEQYLKLSRYFHQETTRFSALADSQDATMRRELERPGHLKYPSGYDIAQRLRDYYRYRADQAGQRAASYDRLLQSPDSKTAAR